MTSFAHLILILSPLFMELLIDKYILIRLQAYAFLAKSIPCNFHPLFLANFVACKFLFLQILFFANFNCDFFANSIFCILFTQMRILRLFLEFFFPCNFYLFFLQIPFLANLALAKIVTV